MSKVQGFLAGYRTYIVIAFSAIDQIGVQLGYWPAEHFREIAEATLGLMFLRAGVSSSGPVAK